MDHPATGGNLGSARVLFRQWRILHLMRLACVSIMGVWISPDGSTLTLASVGSRSCHSIVNLVSIVQIPVTGPGRLHFLYRVITENGFIRLAAADASVRHFLVDLGSGGPSPTFIAFGWVDHGRLVPLKPSARNVSSGAW